LVTKLDEIAQQTQELSAQMESKDKELQEVKEQMANLEVQAQLKVRSLEDDIKSMREDMKNMFEVIWKAKQNDGTMLMPYQIQKRNP
jgi:predicted nuclease with TOPRIM domain